MSEVGEQVHVEQFLADVATGPMSVRAEAERLAANVRPGSGGDLVASKRHCGDWSERFLPCSIVLDLFSVFGALHFVVTPNSSGRFAWSRGWRGHAVVRPLRGSQDQRY